MMLEELQRRNYSQTTVKGYLKIVESFAKHFHRPPDQLLILSGPECHKCFVLVCHNATSLYRLASPPTLSLPWE
jgi:hypothetical protein